MMTLPPSDLERAAWQIAGRLILQAGSTGGDIDAAAFALERALFVNYRLAL